MTLPGQPTSVAWQALAELPIDVGTVRLRRLEQVVGTRGFRRVTTIVQIEGAGQEGAGEDVGYDAHDHHAAPSVFDLAGLAGRRTLGRFAALLDGIALWPRPPAHESSRRYRRWAFESAALDLALRQAGISLTQALARCSHPLEFLASLGLPGDPPTLDPVHRRLERYPGLRLKLDPTPAWSQALLREVASTGAVSILDLKGIPRGTPVDQIPDAPLYRRVLEIFPEAWIEDPGVTGETRALLGSQRHRITWDAPIGAPEDLDRLPWRPSMINVKPSRFGTLARLLATYERCEREGIGMYGGGQFELGPGRAQIQRLASIFHPGAPNDVAPAGYNAAIPPPGLPPSPLDLGPPAPGFG